MKLITYTLLISLLYSISSCAQTKFTAGIKTFEHAKFKVVQSSIIASNQRSWHIYPENNKYKYQLPQPIDNYQFKILRSDIHVDENAVTNIIYNNLNNKLHLLHNAKETLGILFVFETGGTLASTAYTLRENTIITPAEIEMIDNDLKRKVKVSFTGSDYKYYKAVSYPFPSFKF